MAVKRTALCGALIVGGALAPTASAGAQTPKTIAQLSDNTWYEGDLSRLTVSTAGDRAIFRRLGRPHLMLLPSGREDSTALAAGLDDVDNAAMCGNTVARHGQRGGERGWFVADEKAITTIPDDAVLRCSPDGSQIAFYRATAPRDGIAIGTREGAKPYRFDGEVTGAVFAPDGQFVYVAYIDDNGSSTLEQVAVSSGETRAVTRDLDMMPGDNSLGISPDARYVYVALASAGAPDNAQRHVPYAKRFLQLYAIDVQTGARARIRSSAHDEYDANVIGKMMYWARVIPHKAVGVIPASGGEVREILQDGDLPLWSPDGRRISYTYDYDRMADGALPMDVGVISVNANARPTSRPQPFVTGYHEDFSAAWSPNGKWIAWHSHRPPTPVPFYESPGHIDDVMLRKADDRHAPEIRLTDFGWEVGPPFWSPDGSKLLFSSWDKGGTPRIDKLWVLTMDQEAGRALQADRLMLPSGIRSAQWAVWSPDGKHLAIEDNQGGHKRALWIVGVDGSAGQKILDYEGSTYGGLDWSPDGTTIVYSGLAGDRLQLFAISPGGGTPRRLTHDSENILHPRFSPDGRWIACSRLAKEHLILSGAAPSELRLKLEGRKE